ncbi:MAG: hypothetical protein HQK55_06980, partial [Deltaproteobacteria bacterium]|nr:hypothetical protein [Deltaproteobacteria bacterium]
MENAFWTLTFEAERVKRGASSVPAAGVAITIGNRIFGGDSAYYYMGAIFGTGGDFSIVARVTRHNDQVPSIFGDVKEFVLNLRAEPLDHLATLSTA